MTVDNNLAAQQAARDAAMRRAAEARQKMIAEQQQQQAQVNRHEAPGDRAPVNDKTVEKDTFVNSEAAKETGKSQEELGKLYDKFDNDGEAGLSEGEFDAAFREASRPEPLARGAKGDDVVALQKKLNEAGANPPLAEDGAFGPLTEGALKNYQKENGLPETGQTDNDTQDAFEGLTPAVKQQAQDQVKVADAQGKLAEALQNPPRPGATLDKDGIPDPAKAAEMQKTGDELQKSVDALPDGPDKQAMQEQVAAYQKNLTDVLGKEKEVGEKTRAFNGALAAQPIDRDAVTRAMGDLQKATGDDFASPAMAAAGAKLMDAKGPVRTNNGGDASDWAVSLVKAGVKMDTFSVDDRMNMLNDCTRTHDGDVKDDTAGPAEATQVLVATLAVNPDPATAGKLSQLYKDLPGDAKDRLAYFLTGKAGNEQNLQLLPKDVVADMAEHVQTDHGCRDFAKKALESYDAFHAPQPQQQPVAQPAPPEGPQGPPADPRRGGPQ